jgi:hypothetical protein
MISDSLPPHQTPAGTVKPYAAEGSYVDWAAIFAGGVFAMAISFLLISFGASLGLSLTSPYRGEGVSASWLAIAAGIWFAWVMVTGFGAGGYLAGRMRRRAGDAKPDEVEVRDGVHGLLVWATGALVGTVLASAGVGGLVTAGTSAVGSTVGTAAEVASEAASSDYFANLMLRSPIRETEPTPSDMAQSTDGAGTTGTSDAPLAQTTTDQPADGVTTGMAPVADDARAASTSGLPSGREGADATGVSASVRQEIASIIMRSTISGEMAERDRGYLAQLVAANTDLDEDAARTRVDEVNAEIVDARATALAAVERARVAGVVFGFIAAATLLIGAVAAFYAAAAGGRHRDEGLGFDIFAARH